MYETIREKINSQFGSINKLSKIINVESCDLYSAFKGNKPLYPKYKRLIAEALGEDVSTLFTEEES